MVKDEKEMVHLYEKEELLIKEFDWNSYYSLELIERKQFAKYLKWYDAMHNGSEK